jgi:hypothetical protein
MGNITTKEHPKDITGKELKVGNRYRYYGRNGKLEKCRTLKKKKYYDKNFVTLGWDMGWKPRKQFKWGGLVFIKKNVKQFRLCKNLTRKK